MVFGGAVRTEGQLSVFHSGAGAEEDSPCYRCVFPDMPDAMQAPGCSEAGILGPVTGVIGTMQALAAVRLVLGIGGRQASCFCLTVAMAVSWRSARHGVPVARAAAPRASPRSPGHAVHGRPRMSGY
ncbi:MAG: HesA/MoeB/ThiF family protein [Candidatus Puniceispirillaceae bacterium]